MRFIISLSIVLLAFDATKIRRIKQALRRISSPRMKLLAAGCDCLHLIKINCLALWLDESAHACTRSELRGASCKNWKTAFRHLVAEKDDVFTSSCLSYFTWCSWISRSQAVTVGVAWVQRFVRSRCVLTLGK
jgi:hypothetical protein